jgi:uncharacterized membrane protein YedE/YeeE
MDWLDPVLAEPWPFWVAGLALGAFVPLFALATGKALGISSGYAEMCALARPAGPERWKLWFALGLPLGGLAAHALSGPVATSTEIAMLSERGVPIAGQLALLFAGGALVGWGARQAGGCTSGHSIVGVALGAKSSLLATLGFMLGGFVASQALFRLLGGAP